MAVRAHPRIRETVRRAMRPVVLRWVFLVVFIANTALGVAVLSSKGHVWMLGDGYWVAADMHYGLYAGHYPHTPLKSSMPPDEFLDWWRFNSMGKLAAIAYRPMLMAFTSFVAFFFALVAWGWFLISRRRLKYVGRCQKCLYDRAGLEVGAACPECGARP